MGLDPAWEEELVRKGLIPPKSVATPATLFPAEAPASLLSLEFQLPYPPSVNMYWRRVGAKTLVSEEGRRYRKNIMATMRLRRFTALKGHLEIEIDMHPPDNRRRDVDNVLKALLDGLAKGGAYADDSQIVRLVITKRKLVKSGAIVARIREYEP